MAADDVTAATRRPAAALELLHWRGGAGRLRWAMGLPLAWADAVRRLLWGHHGIWSLGIGLLRNLRMAHKTALVALALMLPGGLLIHDTLELWRARHALHQGSHSSFDQYRAFTELNITLDALFRQVQRREQQLQAERLPLLRVQEASQYKALRKSLESVDVASTGAGAIARGAAKLASSREKMLAHLDDESPAAVPGTPSPRWAAVIAYAQDLQTLRAALASERALVLDHDIGVKMLRTGLTDPQFQLLANLSRIGRIGQRLYTGDHNEVRVRDMGLLMAKSELLLEQAQPMFEHVRGQHLLDMAEADRLLGQVQAFLRTADKLVRTAAAAPGAELAVRSEIDPAAFALKVTEAVDASARLQTMALAAMGERVQADHEAYASRLIGRSATFVLLTLCGLYLMVCLHRVMAGGLATLCQHLDDIGRGNLSVRPRGWGQDEIGQALNIVGRASEGMARTFSSLDRSISAVGQHGGELAERHEALIASRQHNRTSIEEGTHGVRACDTALGQCADQVADAAEQVRGLHIDAQRSRQAVSGLDARMALLQTRSREINRVIGLVETVAFQTKLLSLNASVEAARAGTAGRGFAVVAQEVRALAQRSEDAAHKIRGIVGLSVAEIDEGRQMSDRAGHAVRRTEQACQHLEAAMATLLQLTQSTQAQSMRVSAITHEVQPAFAEQDRLVQQLTETCAALRQEGEALRRTLAHVTPRE